MVGHAIFIMTTWFFILMARTFNTLEEASKIWKKEQEKALVKSGIFCYCTCYHMEDNIKKTNPISECKLLLPKEVYKKFETNTKEEDKYYDSNAQIAVIAPGIIRVKLYSDEKNNYLLKEQLCKRSCDVEILLKRYLGQKIRLGKNLLIT